MLKVGWHAVHLRNGSLKILISHKCCQIRWYKLNSSTEILVKRKYPLFNIWNRSYIKHVLRYCLSYRVLILLVGCILVSHSSMEKYTSYHVTFSGSYFIISRLHIKPTHVLAGIATIAWLELTEAINSDQPVICDLANLGDTYTIRMTEN